jgi:hypothetical protein
MPDNSDLYKGDWPHIRVDQKITDKNNLYVRWMRRLFDLPALKIVVPDFQKAEGFAASRWSLEAA